MKDFLRLLSYVRPYKGRLALAILCSIGISITYLGLFSLLQPAFDEVLPGQTIRPAATAGKFQVFDQVRTWIDAYARGPLAGLARAARGGSAGTAVLIAALVVAGFVLKGLFTFLSGYLTRWAGLHAVRDLRADLNARIQRQSLSFFAEFPSGQLISRVMSDVWGMQRLVSGDLAEIFRLVAIASLQAAWLFYLNARLAAFCLILAPVLVYPVVRLGTRLKATARRSMERHGDALGIMKENLAGVRIVQAFGMENFEIRRFNDALGRMLRLEKKAARIVSLTAPVLEFIGACGLAALVAYAGRRIAAGRLTPGEFVTFLTALGMIFASLKNLARINNEAQHSLAAARRVFEVMDTERCIVEAPDAAVLPPFRERIEFRDVAFSYGPAPVLRGIVLSIRAGEVVAIVGHSGAGKSTLVNLLPRFHDVTGGAVFIDGQDVRAVTLESLRRQIGLVTQEVLLFDDTVRRNIAYGRADIPDARIVAAARAAHADGFVRALPQGYDTPIGEGGQRLSLGQRQRLSIARAILKDSPILILDEATSSLDAQSEAEVQQALGNLMAGRTVLVIAHRLATVRRADRIVVLDGGRIVEQGTHVDLLERRGLYARLHALQFRDPDRAAAGAPGAPPGDDGAPAGDAAAGDARPDLPAILSS
jgi:subfamily B ATP-binding cassette protein MsbA